MAQPSCEVASAAACVRRKISGLPQDRFALIEEKSPAAAILLPSGQLASRAAMAKPAARAVLVGCIIPGALL
jgi:hypothetical protein